MDNLDLKPFKHITFSQTQCLWMVPVLRGKHHMAEELIVELLCSFDPEKPKDRKALLVCLQVSQQFYRLSQRLAYYDF